MKKIYLYAFFCILLGILLYVFFRTDVIFLQILEIDHSPLIVLGSNFLENFILYNLADILWALALLLFATGINDKPVRIIALIIPTLMELLQCFKVGPGTFDIIDLIAYIVISLLFFVIWKRKKYI